MYIQGKYVNGTDNLSICYSIRGDCFPPDEEDGVALHTLCYLQGTETENLIPVGTGRIIYDGEQYEISCITVKENYRLQGYGEFIVKLLLYKAFQNKASNVYANVPQNTISFFEKVGFKIIDSYRTKQDFYEWMIISEKNINKCCNTLKNKVF